MHLEVEPDCAGGARTPWLLRLAPYLMMLGSAAVAGTVTLAVMQNSVKANADEIAKTQVKNDQQDKQVQALREQAVRVDERLQRVNEKLDDQRRAQDQTQQDVRHILELLQPTAGRR